MSTTVHIPPALLAEVDERAKALKLSRNRFIVEALRTTLSQTEAWSPGFLAALSELEPSRAARDAVGEMERAIRGKRRNKKAPAL